ncbi:MAG: pyridoxal phosphate-dependent aminotransferase family protein, partial [Gemmataceae bacterium]|nr:pyridoxal phosphate-dependent aminotransferase family protein [Gemmataceae bacterium]
DGRPALDFGDTNALGFDRHSRVVEAYAVAARNCGIGSAGRGPYADDRRCAAVEERIAQWLGTEAAVLFPTAAAAHLGSLPALVNSQDVVAVDEAAPTSLHDAARLCRGGGVRSTVFAHDNSADLVRSLRAARPFRFALVAATGVSAVTGNSQSLAEIADAARRHDAVLFVDDTTSTGIQGRHGRGAALEELAGDTNALVIGSLAEALSCRGGFVGCSAAMKRQLTVRASAHTVAAPHAAAELAAIDAVLDLLHGDEYELRVARLRRNITHLASGAGRLGLAVLGGITPCVAVLVGDEETTLDASAYLLDRGFFVPPAIYPTVPYHTGMLRVHLTAGHGAAEVDALLGALAALQQYTALPGVDAYRLRAA